MTFFFRKQVRMYRSETGVRCCKGARQTLRFHTL